MLISSKKPLILSLLLVLSSCQSAFQPPIAAPAQIAERTMSGDILAALPPAKRKVAVSVYDFQDQTGQMKPEDTFAQYSRAVTQGGLSILNKALLDAGHRGWFTVIERGGLKDLTQERQIIQVTRDQYHAPGAQVIPLKPMLYAGILLEGAIVAYESNIITGGAGAKYLGVGGDTQYRRDIVTVYLRAVSTQTGEVLLSVNTSKTIYSTAIDASVFKYVSFDKLLELETGFTANEPPQFAVRQAIEMAVYALIMEGTMDGLWEFADPHAQQVAIGEYLERKGSGGSTERDVNKAVTAMNTPAPVATPVAVPPPAPQPAPQPVAATVPPAPPAPPIVLTPPPEPQIVTAPAPMPVQQPIADAQTYAQPQPQAEAPIKLIPPAPAVQAVQAPMEPPQDNSVVNLNPPAQNGRLLPDSKYSQMRSATRKCNTQSDVSADGCIM